MPHASFILNAAALPVIKAFESAPSCPGSVKLRRGNHPRRFCFDPGLLCRLGVGRRQRLSESRTISSRARPMPKLPIRSCAGAAWAAGTMPITMCTPRPTRSSVTTRTGRSSRSPKLSTRSSSVAMPAISQPPARSQITTRLATRFLSVASPRRRDALPRWTTKWASVLVGRKCEPVDPAHLEAGRPSFFGALCFDALRWREGSGRGRAGGKNVQFAAFRIGTTRISLSPETSCVYAHFTRLPTRFKLLRSRED